MSFECLLSCYFFYICLGASEAECESPLSLGYKKKGRLQKLWMSPGGCRMECLTCPTWLALWWAATAAMPWVKWIGVEAVLKLLGKRKYWHETEKKSNEKMQTMLNSDQQADFDPLYITHSPHQSSVRLSVGLCGWVIHCRRLSFPTLAFVFGCGQAKGSATCFTQSCSQSHRKTQTVSNNKQKRQACCAVRFCSVFVILRAPLHSEILQDLTDSIPC